MCIVLCIESAVIIVSNSGTTLIGLVSRKFRRPQSPGVSRQMAKNFDEM